MGRKSVTSLPRQDESKGRLEEKHKHKGYETIASVTAITSDDKDFKGLQGESVREESTVKTFYADSEVTRTKGASARRISRRRDSNTKVDRKNRHQRDGGFVVQVEYVQVDVGVQDGRARLEKGPDSG
jgi:hypothetical protein